jgi:hypothetical protein
MVQQQHAVLAPEGPSLASAIVGVTRCVGENQMFDPTALDVVPEEARPRPLYFMSLGSQNVEDLKAKGYEPVSLLTLPRRTEAELEHYHKCYLQGVSEETIVPSKAQIDGSELDMKAHDRLDKRKFTEQKASAQGSSALDEALHWRESRHAFGTSTSVDPRDAIELIRKIKSLTVEQIEALTRKDITK